MTPVTTQYFYLPEEPRFWTHFSAIEENCKLDVSIVRNNVEKKKISLSHAGFFDLPGKFDSHWQNVVNRDVKMSFSQALIQSHYSMVKMCQSCTTKSFAKTSEASQRRVRNARHVSEAVHRKRRLAANAREKRRMDSINLAFDKLRSVLPQLKNQAKFSKYDSIQMAQTYIKALSDLLV
ncbi:Myc-type basic helix-loop-helix (bHLH) domain [Trinorchestia longiramus]|nr:Myc-type basic helix-loop-helix (bHLH) domain [Trinorchestia longiramus]